MAFLYSGADPVQTGVDPRRHRAGTHVGVVRGRVLDGAGDPLPSVTVTVVDHPELGQTVTRADGRYDLAVNAGGEMTLRYERPTYLTVDRTADPRCSTIENLEDVVLRQLRRDGHGHRAGRGGPRRSPARA